MNIAFDCERMKYPHTGLFEYCHQLGLALDEQAAPGNVVKYYVRDENRHFFKPGSKFLTQYSYHKLIFPKYRNLDLYHVTYQTSLYIPRSSSIKKVMTIHDLNFLYEEKSDFKRKQYLDKHQRSIDKIDHIVAISEYTKSDVLKHLDTAGKPITVIYNGCAEGIFLPNIQPAIPPAKKFLFGLGTVNAKKNFHVLIPLLEGNDFELILAGRIDTVYAHKIMAEAVKYKVSNRVKVIGTISDQDKSWYLKNCEAFLFPSIAEGFGIPPIEAMRFGKPVFLSKATSLPEIGGDAAYYFNTFEPGDIKQVFDQGMSHYAQNQPAEAIIKHAHQFNWADSAKAYWEVYRKVLNG